MNMKEQLAIILAAVNGKEVELVPHNTEYIETRTVTEGHQFNFYKNHYQIAPPYQKGEIIMVQVSWGWVPVTFDSMNKFNNLQDGAVVCKTPRGMELFVDHRKLNAEERGKVQ